jgi:acetyl-CoA carboxylase carboxyltransferase component
MPNRCREIDSRLGVASLVPVESNRPYGIRDRVAALVGNQPMMLAGVLDSEASQKAARLVCFCDAFGIPVVSLVDVPGFPPGTDQEHHAAIRHGAKLCEVKAFAPRSAVGHPCVLVGRCSTVRNALW